MSPVEPIPTILLTESCETLRCCLLGILNLCFWLGELATQWTITAYAPIPKPGKDSSCLDGNRPISLLSPFVKMYDKLLHARVGPAISASTGSWQGGGKRGADECAWLLSMLPRANRALNNVKHTWVAFIDGESAFCRPPRSIILRALRRIPMGDNEWLGIGSLLGSLRGTLKLGHILFGLWLVESLHAPLLRNHHRVGGRAT